MFSSRLFAWLCGCSEDLMAGSLDPFVLMSFSLFALNLSWWANMTCKTDLTSSHLVGQLYISRVRLPQKVVHVAQQKEEHWDRLRKLENKGLLQHELDEGGPPHEHAGSQGQPLVMGDGLVLRVPATSQVNFMRETRERVPDGQRDEQVQWDGDQDWSQKTD